MSRTEIDRMNVLHDLADGRIWIAEASMLRPRQSLGPVDYLQAP
jgi:hypothetical protein